MKTNCTASRMWNHSVAFYKMHNTKEYLHITFKAGLREQRRVSIVLFIAIVLFSIIKSFPWNLSSRSLKYSSSVSKLDPWNLILDTRKSKIKTWSLKIETRFSKTSSIENRVSSRDCQLTFERYCTYIHVHSLFLIFRCTTILELMMTL